MASQHVHNEHSMLSPRKETAKLSAADLFADDSPTGIMAFPGMGGSSRKPVLPRPAAEAVDALGLTDHSRAQDAVTDEELEMRAIAIVQYWRQVERNLAEVKTEFVVPPCDTNAFQGFRVTEGYVRHMALKWDLFFAPTPPTLMASLEPSPGPAVREMIRFFECFGARQVDDSMEPFFMVHKRSVGRKVSLIMAELEARLVMQMPLDVESPVVYRHVGDKIRPLVEAWNARCAPVEPLANLVDAEPQCLHKNPRIIIMANLMKKKFDQELLGSAHTSEVPRHAGFGPLVMRMVQLLEEMNNRTRTGHSDVLDVGHVHHVPQLESLRLVC